MYVLLGDAELRTNLRKGEPSLAQFRDQMTKGQFWTSTAFTLLGHVLRHFEEPPGELIIIAREAAVKLIPNGSAPKTGITD
jgi:hypothetical protein